MSNPTRLNFSYNSPVSEEVEHAFVKLALATLIRRCWFLFSTRKVLAMCIATGAARCRKCCIYGHIQSSVSATTVVGLFSCSGTTPFSPAISPKCRKTHAIKRAAVKVVEVSRKVGEVLEKHNERALTRALDKLSSQISEKKSLLVKLANKETRPFPKHSIEPPKQVSVPTPPTKSKKVAIASNSEDFEEDTIHVLEK